MQMRKGKRKVKVVVFDLDGVLMDSIKWIGDAFKYALKEEGLKFNKKIYVTTSGQNLEEVYKRMVKVAHSNVDANKLVKLHREWQSKNFGEVKPFPNAKKSVRWASKNYTLAMWTGRGRKFAEKQLKKYGLEKYFKVKVYADDVKHSKPHPEGLLKILRVLKTKPSETVLVGDAINDMIAGRAAKVIRVAALYGAAGNKLRGMAPYYIKRIDELPKILSRIEQTN